VRLQSRLGACGSLCSIQVQSRLCISNSCVTVLLGNRGLCFCFSPGECIEYLFIHWIQNVYGVVSRCYPRGKQVEQPTSTWRVYHFNASLIILGPLHRRACATSARLLFSAAELKYNILRPIIAALDPILNIVTSIPSLCFEWASFWSKNSATASESW